MSQQLFASHTITRSDPTEVENRLEELGLTPEILLKALEAGERGRMSCGPLAPKTSAGFYGWSETATSLREQLLPLGWTIKDEQNLPTVVDPLSKIEIMVSTGTEGTGRSWGEPSSKSEKGDVVKQRVRSNRGQATIAELLPESSRPVVAKLMSAPSKDETTTWILLLHSNYNPKSTDDGDGEDILYSELSLPDSTDERGNIDHFAERIILDPVRLNDRLLVDEEPEESDDGIDIEVTRI